LAENTPVAPTKVEAVKVSPASLVSPKVEATTAPPPEPTKSAEQLKFEAEAAKLDARSREIEKQHSRLARERQEWSKTRKDADAQAQKFADWEKLEADRKRNPIKYFEKEYGENWRDVLARIQLDGTPPADLVASAMDERTAQLEKQLAEKNAALEKRIADFEVSEANRSKEAYLASCATHAKDNADKYPLLNHFGEFNSIRAEVERHFRATARQDFDGNWLPGETLSPEQASARVEEGIGKLRKAFQEFEAKQKPAAPKGTTPETRRSKPEPASSNDWTPPKSEAERKARAFAAADQSLRERGLLQ
jgi:hypothetical protein